MTIEDPKTALAARDDAFKQLQQELAGETAGRGERFLSHSARAERDPKEQQKRKDREAQTRAILLASASYLALRQDFAERLTKAETLVATEIARVRDALQAELETLTDLRDRAAKLPDGTPVFRDAHGEIWTADGERVTHREEEIVFPPDAPSCEDWLMSQARTKDLEERLRRLEHLEIAILGRARDRLDDDRDLITEDEMNELLEEIERELEAERLREPEPASVQSVNTAPNASLPPLPSS